MWPSKPSNLLQTLSAVPRTHPPVPRMSEGNTQKFVLTIESLINVPKMVGTFFVRWKVTCDGRIVAKGRTTNSVLRSFRVTWNEQAKFDVPRKAERSFEVQLAAAEVLDGGDTAILGSANLGLDPKMLSGQGTEVKALWC